MTDQPRGFLDGLYAIPAAALPELVQLLKPGVSLAERYGRFRGPIADEVAKLKAAAAVVDRERVIFPPFDDESRSLGPERMLATVDVAARLGCTPQRVGQLVADGSLCGRKLGRAWLVTVESVDAHLAKMEAKR